jgi:hypothetical protein
MPNEASVVHCFDESNRKALKKTQLGREQDSVSDRTLANLAKKRLFAEFRVPRDSPTFGFVAVGEPPTPEELGQGTWLAPQIVELSLPSGLLRMETALSFSLWPETPQADGAFAEVPPGNYRLTFVVAESAPPDRPRIFLTLTPLTGSVGAVEVKTRPAPPPLPKNSKLGRYTVANGRFLGWRQDAVTNVDRKAAEELGLTFGEKVRFESKSSKCDAWYLGGFDLSGCLTNVDFLALSNGGAGHRFELFCEWVGHPDANKWRVLSVFRFVTAADYPQPQPQLGYWLEQKQRREQGQPPLEPPKLSLEELARLADETPIYDRPRVERPEKLTVTVLQERLKFEAAALDDWSLEGGALHARVLTWATKVVTLNVSPAGLAKLGGTEGEFELEIAGQTRRVVLLPRQERERPGNVAANFRCRYYTTHDELPQWLLSIKASRKLPDDLVSALTPEGTLLVDAARFVEWEGGALVQMSGRYGKPIREAAARGTPLLVSPPPVPDPPILCAVGIPHWADSKREILWLESGSYRRDYSARAMWDLLVPHALPGPTGAPVTLRLCSPS